MDMGIVESGEHPPPFRVDHRRRRSPPGLDPVGIADVDDAIADDGDGIRGGLKEVAGPHVRARDDEVCRKPRRARTAHGEGARERD
jgi:hypothetical protein